MTIKEMQRMLRACGLEIAESEILLNALRAGKEPTKTPTSSNTLEGITCNVCDDFLVDEECQKHT